MYNIFILAILVSLLTFAVQKLKLIQYSKLKFNNLSNMHKVAFSDKYNIVCNNCLNYQNDYLIAR